MACQWCILWIVVSTFQTAFQWKLRHLALEPLRLSFEDKCNNVCADLPKDDAQPVCMMFSRYKKGYQFFVNQCHARRSICKENMMLHMVHPKRCLKNKQFFKPIN